MPTTLVTGAREGLGLEFARQYAADGWRVLATCLQPASADALHAAAEEAEGRIEVIELDVEDHGMVEALALDLRGEAIDVLINNAAQLGGAEQDFGIIDFDRWAQVLRTNLFGPAKVCDSFVEHVARSQRKTMVAIGSGLGLPSTVGEPRRGSGGGSCGGAERASPLLYYRTSKAALHAMNQALARYLAPRGVTVLTLAPGHTRTAMGGADAPLSAAESVRGMRAVIADASLEKSGRLYRYDGRAYPW